MLKSLKIASIFSTLSILTSGCGGLADIRPDTLKPEPSATARDQGRALLAEVIEAHGGLTPWQNQGVLTARYRDRWDAWLPKVLFMEWEENNQLAEVKLHPAHFGHATFTFLDGDNQGEVWGLNRGRPYKQTPGQDQQFKDDADLELFLKTVEFMVGFPFRLANADQVAYAGQRQDGEQVFDIIFLSWKTLAPQKDYDQWALWINPQTKLIERTHFTVRAFSEGIDAAYAYEDYRNVGGMMLPHRIIAKWAIDDPDPVHTFEFEQIVAQPTSHAPRHVSASHP